MTGLRLLTEDSRPRVAWQLTHGGGNSFLLMNAGTGTAYDVTVEPLDEHAAFRGPESGAGIEIGPTEDMRFSRHSHMSRPGPLHERVLVSWLDHPHSDERHEWRRNLPPS